MKRIKVLTALALSFAMGGAAIARPLKVMTFNLRYASDTPPNSWAERRPVMVELLRRSRPDLVGTQELVKRQGDDLAAALPGYRWFGRDRFGTHVNEHMGILYRTDRLRIVRQGDFWLSDTPDTPGSMSWGVDLPRMVNWAVFETLGRDPRRFLFLDTHLAHRDEDEGARERSARMILDRLPVLAHGLPVVLAGDMNARPGTGTYKAFADRLADTRTHAVSTHGPDLTFHDFTGTPDRRIDYLFVRGFRVGDVTTDTYHQGAIYPSDHFPVVATLTFARR